MEGSCSTSSETFFSGHLPRPPAVGGITAEADSTSEVREYNAATNSWIVISQMWVPRYKSLTVVLSDNTLMVCGGVTSAFGCTASIEIALI